MNKRNLERDAYVLKRLSEGATYADIGRELGITRERVRQIAKRLDIKRPPNRSHVVIPEDKACQLRELAAHEPPLRWKEIADRMGVHVSKAVRWARQLGIKKPRAMRREAEDKVRRVARLLEMRPGIKAKEIADILGCHWVTAIRLRQKARKILTHDSEMLHG